MNDGNPIPGVEMGMSVFVRRSAVGGPARVGNRHVAFGRRLLQEPAEVGELSGALEDLNLFAVLKGDAGAIVAPIFQTFKLIEYHLDRVSGADIAGDATHRLILANGLADRLVSDPLELREMTPERFPSQLCKYGLNVHRSARCNPIVERTLPSFKLDCPLKRFRIGRRYLQSRREILLRLPW